MANNGNRHLFGIEVEFGFAARGPDGRQISPGLALDGLLELLSQRVAHLRGRDGIRMFLANGALVYPDVGHPEWSGPECESPSMLVGSLRAGERLLAEIAEELGRSPHIRELNLYRSNVDYSAVGTTWGCHESYLSRRVPEVFAKHVVAHLVSRIIYTGAGGFDNRGHTATFAISPRAYHLSNVIGNDRGGARAIFSLRHEALAHTKHSRVHLICGEPNCSELATYLKFGATSLVLAMADAGIEFRKAEYSLRAPVAAMRLFSADAACGARAQCADGTPHSAIEIQRAYLELAETNIGADFMPDWAEDVCSLWRQTLDDLANDPELGIGQLDWPTKLALFKRHVASHSRLSWDSLRAWSVAAAVAARYAEQTLECEVRPTAAWVLSRLGAPSQSGRAFREVSKLLARHGCTWHELDEYFALRNTLCELDMRYGQLYPAGIYMELASAGLLTDRLVDESAIEAARHAAPGDGRAHLRGHWISVLSRRKQTYHCDWTSIMGAVETLDLGDPFVREAKWQPNEIPQRPRRPVLPLDRI